MKKFTMQQRALGLSTGVFLALSAGVAAQTPAGTTTAADIENAGYSDVTEVAPQYDGSVNAFMAVAPDGETVTIEIQQGTGEWLVLRSEPRSVVTTYRAGEAPANALPMRGSDATTGTPGTAAPGMGDPGMTDPGMTDPGMDGSGMDEPGMDDSGMESPTQVQPAPIN